MSRPLLICDCDEVLLHFAGPFASWLSTERALDLSFENFALAGNIRRHSDGSVVDASEIGALVDDFFDAAMHGQPAVDGAAAALEALSDGYEIVILSNIRDAFTERRAEQIRKLGMPYRVRGNSGPKGPAVCRLLTEFGARAAVFIDDLPPHHSSVKQDAPHVHRLHMVADPVLRPLIPAAADAHRRIDPWAEALPYLENLTAGLLATSMENSAK